MKKRVIAILFLLFLFVQAMPSVSIQAETLANEIYVSPNGNDLSDGTINSPIKTLKEAKRRVGELKNSSGGDINIIFRSGIYKIDGSVVFSENDSGTENGQITYKAYENEEVRFSGGTEFLGELFEKTTDENILNKIPKEARSHIYEMPLSRAGINDLCEMTKTNMKTVETPSQTLLLENDKMLQTAKWPNAGYASIGEVLPSAKGWSFRADDDRSKRWADAKNAYLYGRFMYDWADGTVTVSSVDADEGIINTSDTAEYGIRSGREYCGYQIYNLIEEIDIPGEWYIDNSTRTLYLYPENKNIKNSVFSIVSTKEPLLIMDNNSNVNFEGITFEKTRADAIKIINGGCHRFYKCNFINIGQQAVTIDNGVKNKFDYCIFRDIAKGGINITGGNYKELVPSENNIENCLFENYATISKKYSYAVRMYGVGDRVAHCRIHNGTHFAVYFLGNNNIIEYNDIYDVTQDARDSSAIYAGRSWANGGTIIRYNYIHDCIKGNDTGRAAVYCDDWMTGVTIRNNVFSNLNQGVSLHTSQFCTVENNLMINCRIGVHLNNRNDAQTSVIEEANKKIDAIYRAGEIREKFSMASLGDSNTLFNKYYERYNPDSEAWTTQFPYLATLFEAGKTYSPRNDVVKNNVFIRHRETVFHWNNTPFHLQPDAYECTYENNVVFDGLAPLVDEKNKNYNLTDYSFIKEKIPSFEILDIKSCGIEDEENLKMNEFSLISPVNGEENIDAHNVILMWNTNSGADSYRVVVAKDSEFKDVVCDEIVGSATTSLVGDAVGYRKLTNLRYGKQRYYWKVIGISNDYHYEGNTEKECSNVYSFTTAFRENANKEKLTDIYNQAENAYNSAVEGTNSGEYIKGAKDFLKPKLDVVQHIIADKSSSKKQVVYYQNELQGALMQFLSMKNAQKMNISDLFNDTEGWGKNITVTKASLTSTSAANSGYFQNRLLHEYNILRFKAKFDIKGQGYVSVGLRSSNTTVNPWLTTEYIFLVKNDAVELQKFNGDDKFYYSVPNTMFSDGNIHNVEFGAVNEGQSVRVTLVVDGKEAFNVLDEDNPIMTGNGFHIYNSNASSAVFYSADD